MGFTLTLQSNYILEKQYHMTITNQLAAHKNNEITKNVLLFQYRQVQFIPINLA